MTVGISYHVDDDIALITLNNPGKHNAFTVEVIDAWPNMLAQAQQDDNVRAIVLTGANGTFCSGIDLSVLSALEPSPTAYKNLLVDRIHEVAHMLERIDKPVIAAMEGRAVGAGLDMALMCDMRVAARSATMSEGYVKIGLVPGDGGAYYLPKLVGRAKALELLLTGDFVSADEALRIGMVNHVVEEGEALQGALSLARRITRHSRQATALIKRTVRQSSTSDLSTALDLVSSHFGIVAMSAQTQAIIRPVPAQP